MTSNQSPQKLQHISRRNFLGLASMALLNACTPGPLLRLEPTARPTQAPSSAPAYFPGDEWRTSTPAEQGIDPQGITEMLAKIESEKLPVHSFLLIRHGYLVAEHYFGGYTPDSGHELRSCTKSVTSALTGVAIQEGFLQGVHQKVVDFFPKYNKRSAQLDALTLEHLLTMSAGHRQALTPGTGKGNNDSSNWVEIFMEGDFVHEPGTVFQYDSGAAHIVSAILQEVTGKGTIDYAREKIFTPLGIKDFSWLSDFNGITYGNSLLNLRPLDMAKFGYLFLHEGEWDGQQLISKEWVGQSTVKYVDTLGKMNKAEDDGYGYYWWMNGFGGYSAHGASGQFISIVPEMDLVAVFTGGFAVPEFPTNYELMKTLIIPAVKA
jgi:CubicO group peptidase (beta-lactamase class C family)